MEKCFLKLLEINARMLDVITTTIKQKDLFKAEEVFFDILKSYFSFFRTISSV